MKIRKWMYAVPAVLATTVARAQESSAIDIDAAGDAADQIGTALKTLLTGKVMTNVLTVMGAALAIWAAFLVYRYLKRGAGK